MADTEAGSRVSPMEVDPSVSETAAFLEPRTGYMDHCTLPKDTFNFRPMHVDLEFKELFTEPGFYQRDGGRFGFFVGNKIIRLVFGTLYTYVQLGTYYIFSVLIGFFMAFIWGVVFGLLQTVNVWFINPILKLFFEVFRLFFQLNKALARTCLDPWCQSMGLILSYIRIQLNVKASKEKYEDGGGLLPSLPRRPRQSDVHTTDFSTAKVLEV